MAGALTRAADAKGEAWWDAGREAEAGGGIFPHQRLTLDLDRVPPSESIQMYSAMTLPFWSSAR